MALSAVLYLSAGTLGALLVGLSPHPRGNPARNFIRPGEWVWMGGAILSGAVLAPLLFLIGVRQVSGHVTGLFLNFEAVFTIGLGVLLSGEHLGRRGWIGALAILGGAVILSLPGEAATSAPTRWAGAACVVGACALWGLDTNLTQRVSVRDARQIVAVKGIVGGLTSLALAAAFGGFGEWNTPRLLAAIAVGAVSYGLSIVLFVRGLRRLGVLQTGMLFALAPGFAAILSWSLLRERAAAESLLALGVMTAGALLLVFDRHEHLHEHGATEHAHEHAHDEHHEHEHTPEELTEAPHAHAHRHLPIKHGHGHVHDVHHRHRH